MSKPSILIVDDDDVFRRRLARAFEDRDFLARTAGDYDEAVEQARAESPELAVVDLKMPGRSGLELVQALKDIDPTTKVVVLTGYASIATAIDSIRIGATYYLPKPADADDTAIDIDAIDVVDLFRKRLHCENLKFSRIWTDRLTSCLPASLIIASLSLVTESACPSEEGPNAGVG